MARLFANQGGTEEVATRLRKRLHFSHGRAASQLADLLVGRGHLDEAIAVLRKRVDLGDERAADHLIALLAKQGRLDELAEEVAAGTSGAVKRLASTASDAPPSPGERISSVGLTDAAAS
jgi:hypothetical protein